MSRLCLCRMFPHNNTSMISVVDLERGEGDWTCRYLFVVPLKEEGKECAPVWT